MLSRKRVQREDRLQDALIVQIVLWMMPLLVFAAAESVTGNLFRITPLCIVLNLAVYYLLYGGWLVIFRTTKVGWQILNLIFYVFAVGEYFVISFR